MPELPTETNEVLLMREIAQLRMELAEVKAELVHRHHIDVALLSVQVDLMTLIGDIAPGFADSEHRTMIYRRLTDDVGAKVSELFALLNGAR